MEIVAVAPACPREQVEGPDQDDASDSASGAGGREGRRSCAGSFASHEAWQLRWWPTSGATRAGCHEVPVQDADCDEGDQEQPERSRGPGEAGDVGCAGEGAPDRVDSVRRQTWAGAKAISMPEHKKKICVCWTAGLTSVSVVDGKLRRYSPTASLGNCPASATRNMNIGLYRAKTQRRLRGTPSLSPRQWSRHGRSQDRQKKRKSCEGGHLQRQGQTSRSCRRAEDPPYSLRGAGQMVCKRGG